LIKLTITTKS